MSHPINAVTNAIGLGDVIPTAPATAQPVPTSVTPYTPAPAAQSPQAVQAGQTASGAAANTSATGGNNAGLAGMAAGGLADPAMTTGQVLYGAPQQQTKSNLGT